jgi:hypothetical protein
MGNRIFVIVVFALGVALPIGGMLFLFLAL